MRYVDLALFSSGQPVQAKQIAERQGIPKQYLDQLMMDLKKAGLVVSLRGRQGGYQLARPAGAISLWEAITTFEVPIESGRFVHTRGSRPQASRKIVKQFWDDACLRFGENFLRLSRIALRACKIRLGKLALSNSRIASLYSTCHIGAVGLPDGKRAVDIGHPRLEKSLAGGGSCVGTLALCAVCQR